MSTSQEPTITLYTAQTPNGVKISTLLEELGLQYKVYKINARANEQKEPWFLAINPNGRIPALTDVSPTDPTKTIRIFESGAIMQYLVSRYDPNHLMSFPPSSPEHHEMTSWLFLQNASLGPVQGQANHFFRYCAADPIPYAIDRFQGEVKRVYGVLEDHLASLGGGPYIMGEKCTIADLAHWGWVSAGPWAGVELDAFPNLKAWEERVWARPAVKKGADVPEPYNVKKILADKKLMEETSKGGREFVSKGMKLEREQNEERERRSKV
ncbi:glutathione S-transferase [Myriangium duriaei CBS 260.36]|uniref:Glutathione S-transferase n=1 Tax=Myriangium duriaei CBS 260.36 TaxID=1168546 RepID=A0A9P4MNG9_9PEZI|nr:glutathione S-transferase [Myriangium duriaei CBS 260.36]